MQYFSSKKYIKLIMYLLSLLKGRYSFNPNLSGQDEYKT